MKTPNLPEAWDEERVRRVLEHCEEQSDEGAVAEDEAAYESTTRAAMDIRSISSQKSANFSPNAAPANLSRAPITSLSMALVLGAVKTSSLRDDAACRGASGLDRASAPARCRQLRDGRLAQPRSSLTRDSRERILRASRRCHHDTSSASPDAERAAVSVP